MICKDCKSEFKQRERGCKVKPIPICPQCNIRRVIFSCNNCSQEGCIKEEFYRRTCFECGLDGCSKCIPYIVEELGIEFELCEEHKDYDREKIRESAKELSEESADLHRIKNLEGEK